VRLWRGVDENRRSAKKFQGFKEYLHPWDVILIEAPRLEGRIKNFKNKKILEKYGQIS